MAESGSKRNGAEVLDSFEKLQDIVSLAGIAANQVNYSSQMVDDLHAYIGAIDESIRDGAMDWPRQLEGEVFNSLLDLEAARSGYSMMLKHEVEILNQNKRVFRGIIIEGSAYGKSVLDEEGIGGPNVRWAIDTIRVMRNNIAFADNAIRKASAYVDAHTALYEV